MYHCYLFGVVSMHSHQNKLFTLTQVGCTSEHHDATAVLKLTEMVHPHHASFVSAD